MSRMDEMQARTVRSEWKWRGVAILLGIVVGVVLSSAFGNRYRVLENRRIDSWTGKSWVLRNRGSSDSVKFFWVEVSEPSN